MNYTTIFVALAVAFLTQQVSAAPQSCDSATNTGKEFNVLGDSINVREGPGTNFPKIINQKATRIMKKTQYITIDSSTRVYEECVRDGWSKIQVVHPEWFRDSHRGWIESKFLDKGQSKKSGDKYAGRISSYALSPYTKKSYPKTIQKYGSRLTEIEKFRKTSAQMALDSGKCDFVEMSELSTKSSLNALKFWVDCRNGQRIYLTESEIIQKAEVKTQQEKAWTKAAAIEACKRAIKDRALIPSEVDIHQIFGTRYYQAPVTHNVVLEMDFDAKNAFGTEIPYTAKCHFEPDEVGTIEIRRR